jgi:hypothetical protein
MGEHPLWSVGEALFVIPQGLVFIAFLNAANMPVGAGAGAGFGAGAGATGAPERSLLPRFIPLSGAG